MALASRAAASAAVACVLLALAASAAGAGSRSSHSAPAPAPAVDCVSQAATLLDCLEYVQQGSTVRRPTPACCAEVKTAVASPVIVGCLCSLAGSNMGSSMGFSLDMKRVLALPGACGASNDAFSKCNISALTPAGAPAPSSGGSSSGGAVASPPTAAAAGSPMTATALVAAVASPLLAYYCYLF